MKQIVLIAAMLATFLCSVAHATPLTERVAYWQQRVDGEVPIGSSRAAVLEWASRNKLRVSDRRAEHPVNIRLEKLTLKFHERQQATSKYDGICEQYQISAIFMMDNHSQVEKVLLLPIGDCR